MTGLIFFLEKMSIHYTNIYIYIYIYSNLYDIIQFLYTTNTCIFYKVVF